MSHDAVQSKLITDHFGRIKTSLAQPELAFENFLLFLLESLDLR